MYIFMYYNDLSKLACGFRKGEKTIAPPSDVHHLSFPQVSLSKVELLRNNSINRALNTRNFAIELNGKTVQKGFACLTLKHMAKVGQRGWSADLCSTSYWTAPLA